MTAKNYDIIGYPRLIRLNPNIPWKTRGNGAISIQIGIGLDKKIKIGKINDKGIFSYVGKSSKKIENNDVKKIKNIVKNVMEENAKFEAENTNPGFVISRDQLSFDIYKKAVKEIVSLKEVEELLKSIKADYKGYKNRRGLIGAAASIAWSPKFDKTYELIAYREEEKWTTKRFVDSSSVKEMDKICLLTFDNYDYENEHNRLVPNSPCPILYGIRGDDVEELTKASSIVKSEQVDKWIIFETNQGTDDHLQKKKYY